MDFSLPPEVEEYRQQVRRIVAATVTPESIHACHESGTFDIPVLNAALAAEGLVERAVPGLGSGDPIELWVLFNELEKAQVPFDALAVSVMIAGVVNRVGTDEQKARVIPSIIEARSHVCMGYSEPDFGSDVASITTKAVRDGDEWVINGAKMWTTMATERTNATFYDDVRVGDEAVLGDVNEGWSVMTVALSLERGVMGGTNPGVPLLRHFREWAEASGAIVDPVVRERMARVAIDNEVAKLLTQRSAWIAASGGTPGLEGSMTKIFATEAYQKASRWFSMSAGPEGLLQFGEDGAAAGGWIEYDARHSPVTTIYGGTSEINRNNVAERHLGLPKARR